MKADYFELKVELKAINISTGQVITSFGSMPIQENLQDHVEMAGRAAAVQAYLYMLRLGLENATQK